MRIDFKRLEIHNFKSFGDETFDFKKHNGLNLICGKNLDIPGAKNGSGKSNLINALVFSLFGLTQDNIKNCNIANKYLKDKEVRVVTYFSIENHDYKIATGFNGRGSQYCEFYEIDSGTEKTLTKSTLAETRRFIETEILKCDLSIFMRTILLSSDLTYNFFRLLKNEKKEFIEKLFDISVFGDMYSAMHKDVLKYDKDMLSRLNKLLILNKNSDDYSVRILKFESDKLLRLKSLNDLIAELIIKKNEILNRHLTANTAEVEKCEELMQKVSDAQLKILEKQREFQDKNQQIDVKISKLKANRDVKLKTIDRHSELLGKLCNDCKVVFNDYYSITTCSEEIKSIDSLIAKLSEKHSANNSNIIVFTDRLRQCEEKQKLISTKILQLTSEYNKAANDLARIDTMLSNSEQLLSNIENLDNPYMDLKDSNDIELQELTKELKMLEEQYRYLKYAETIVSQDTLRKFIISDLIGLLNNKIKTYLTKFGAKYEVVFDADMNYKLLEGSNEFEYDNFSGGERSRLMIAACFAFRDFMYIRNNFSSNILFLDEFIDGAIDSLAIENIMSILAEYGRQYSQNVFIISHRKSEIDNTIFDHIIQVVKLNNVSKITYIE